MRKSVLAILLAMSMILIFCAGCGGNDDAPVAAVSATMAPTPEPTEEPEATPEPTAEPTPEPTEEPVEEEEPAQEPEEEEDEEPEETTSSNNSGNSGNSNTTQSKPEPTAEPTPAPTEEPEVDKFAIAQTMQGRSVQDLYDAIGRPNGSDYTTSCLVFDGQDGLLYYDGFTVSTVQYADGTELVMGAY